MDIKTLNVGLAKSKRDGTITYKSIAKTIYRIIQNGEKINQVTEIAKLANVSYASITKFIKYIKIENAKILVALINEAVFLEKNDSIENTDQLVKDVAKEIQVARKILFIGASSNHFINLKFGSKLERLDKWVVQPPHKYEQIGLAKLQTDHDLTIIASPSLQHEWIKEIIQRVNGKTVLLTATNFEGADFTFYATKHERVDALRVYTIDTGVQFDKFYGDIFKELIKDKGNNILLKLTRYIP